MTYLNSAAESIPPVTVLDALNTYFSDKAKGMAGRDNHFAELEKCREVAAELLDKSPGEVSFCSCSSEAYNLLASALQLTPADEVVISDLDFPAGVTPWIAANQPPVVKLWSNRGGVLELADLERLLNEKTRLVQVSLVSFLTGYRIPWAPFRDLVRSLAPNAILSVDVTQCFGRIELDCLDADCLISSTHKWLLGTHGSCVVAVPERIADRLTTRAGGWYHISNAFDENRFEKAIPVSGARSFSVGMPNFPAIYALRAGMEYIRNAGVKSISTHADPIISELQGKLTDLGIKTMAPPQPDCPSGIVSFQHPRDSEINDALVKENIHVMRQAGRLRISVHGYNSMEDIDKLIGVLKLWT
ncbi:MAG: aminotransferase class V-fold PLP-dependent enzyme [Verrucomicrobiales bacterium]|nr:aminotransferase class V-fold PLP-dependent enzyme [Verrucomicrobiales bacterium]